MIRKGLSYPIPVTEEMKQAEEQAAAAEQSAIQEAGSNPPDKAEQMPSGQD